MAEFERMPQMSTPAEKLACVLNCCKILVCIRAPRGVAFVVRRLVAFAACCLGVRSRGPLSTLPRRHGFLDAPKACWKSRAATPAPTTSCRCSSTSSSSPTSNSSSRTSSIHTAVLFSTVCVLQCASVTIVCCGVRARVCASLCPLCRLALRAFARGTHDARL